MKFELAAETEKMHAAAEELLRADTLAEQILAKELTDTGKQQSTLYVAKLPEGEDPSFDLGGFSPKQTTLSSTSNFSKRRPSQLKRLKLHWPLCWPLHRRSGPPDKWAEEKSRRWVQQRRS